MVLITVFLVGLALAWIRHSATAILAFLVWRPMVWCAAVSVRLKFVPINSVRHQTFPILCRFRLLNFDLLAVFVIGGWALNNFVIFKLPFTHTEPVATIIFHALRFEVQMAHEEEQNLWSAAVSAQPLSAGDLFVHEVFLAACACEVKHFENVTNSDWSSMFVASLGHAPFPLCSFGFKPSVDQTGKVMEELPDLFRVSLNVVDEIV